MKIGIITLYYQNYNYGGQLQAYALVEALRCQGFLSYQISYDRRKDTNPMHLSRAVRFIQSPYLFAKDAITDRTRQLYHLAMEKIYMPSIMAKLDSRRSAFEQFEARIPHTQVVSANNIAALNHDFDGFVCGSDQIWNPDQFRSAYVLDFVGDSKPKVAYAASIGRDCLTEHQLNYLVEHLNSFNAISVREEIAQQILKEKIAIPVEQVLDPTLLLTREQWNDMSEEYNIDQPYILSYFLGDGLNQRICTRAFANRKGEILLGFPHITGKYRKVDDNFADIDLYDVTPAQFIYLIKNADYIITDSFHACVFSIIFGKRFVVFERQTEKREQKMNIRLQSLLKIFGLEERLVFPNEIDVIESAIHPQWNRYEQLREKSLDFIVNMMTATIDTVGKEPTTLCP